MDAEMQDVSDNDDRISSMPDSILVHVLTFLGAREAVQTCILSKRWEELWAYLPRLNFDNDEIVDDVIFERFVSSFLLLRKTKHLDTLQIRWANYNEVIDVKCVTSWILYAVRCKPRMLSIHAPSYGFQNLPHSIFCGTALEELKLYLEFHAATAAAEAAIIPRSINLPFLRKLSLTGLKIAADFLKKLLLGCPLLEELEIQYCTVPMMVISSPVLKHLTILDCIGGYMFISCPNMTNLHFKMHVDSIILRGLSSLEHAFLYITNNSDLVHFEILSGLSNATEVGLFGLKFKAILAKELANSSTFKNLKQLVLDQCLNSEDLDIIDCFRRFSPNLIKSHFSHVKEELLTTEENMNRSPQYDVDDDGYDDEYEDNYDGGDIDNFFDDYENEDNYDGGDIDNFPDDYVNEDNYRGGDIYNFSDDYENEENYGGGDIDTFPDDYENEDNYGDADIDNFPEDYANAYVNEDQDLFDDN